ncbi:MAG: dihydrodipicolinate synthase family protein [Victivallales bacterium]|jgi:dihydrodipicolinate synthase/N-acetylneuraminate lyase|nr:dihydrodipicolinate synthase family protein [Victivallales bacterium]MBT7299129.1 dihydrodipicolinate synthase family protein [Victivallales bacterium]
MSSVLDSASMRGVWSATPTPLCSDLTVDVAAVPGLVDHHLRLGVRGLFLGGTCGEGPWLPHSQLRRFVRAVVEAAAGRLVLAVQVSDNSAARIAENTRAAAEDGADLAVIAPPSFLLNATAENLVALYSQAIESSPLPIGIYDRGTNGAVVVPNEALAEIYGLQKVVLLKDSSCNPERRDIALAARAKRPGLALLDGDEFHCVDYIAAGYDGLLLGGGIFNGLLAGRIIEAVQAGDLAQGKALQERMNQLMYDVYGGETITCWLTGLKELLVRLGVFSTNASFLNYPLTPECSAAIDAAIERERDVLLP